MQCLPNKRVQLTATCSCEMMSTKPQLTRNTLGPWGARAGYARASREPFDPLTVPSTVEGHVARQRVETRQTATGRSGGRS
jgi:hypothetical protein